MGDPTGWPLWGSTSDAVRPPSPLRSMKMKSGCSDFHSRLVRHRMRSEHDARSRWDSRTLAAWFPRQYAEGSARAEDTSFQLARLNWWNRHRIPRGVLLRAWTLPDGAVVRRDEGQRQEAGVVGPVSSAGSPLGAATAAVADSGPGREHRDPVLVRRRLPERGPAPWFVILANGLAAAAGSAVHSPGRVRQPKAWSEDAWATSVAPLWSSLVTAAARSPLDVEQILTRAGRHREVPANQESSARSETWSGFLQLGDSAQ